MLSTTLVCTYSICACPVLWFQVNHFFAIMSQYATPFFQLNQQYNLTAWVAHVRILSKDAVPQLSAFLSYQSMLVLFIIHVQASLLKYINLDYPQCGPYSKLAVHHKRVVINKHYEEQRGYLHSDRDFWNTIPVLLQCHPCVL